MLRPTNTTPVTTRSTALAGDCGALIVMLMSERDHAGTVISLVQSCPRVGLTHGSGWVGSTTAKVLKI